MVQVDGAFVRHPNQVQALDRFFPAFATIFPIKYLNMVKGGPLLLVRMYTTYRS